MRSKREMQMTLFGSLDMVAFVSHLNWHSFVIKIQYVFFCCMENFLWLTHCELLAWNFLALISHLNCLWPHQHFSPWPSIPTTPRAQVIFNALSAKFSVFLDDLSGKSFSLHGSFFYIWWIAGGFFFFLRQKKLYFELQQKCVIYNYSFSNPVRLPVAELQLDSSFCKLIQSLRFVALFPSRNFF